MNNIKPAIRKALENTLACVEHNTESKTFFIGIPKNQTKDDES